MRYRTYSQLLRSKMAAQPPVADVASPCPAEGAATAAPLAAGTAVTVPPLAERGRPARPTDRYNYVQAVRAGLD